MLGLGLGVHKSICLNSFEGELDKLGIADNAKFIFSPYKRLVKSFKGNLVKVQRTSDYELKWFGYLSNGNLDVASLLSWVGNSDGLVAEVSNQANVDYPIQQLTISKRPKIVINGVFIENGISFDGVDDFFNVTKYNDVNFINPPFSIFMKTYNINNNLGYYFTINNDSGTFAQYGILNSASEILFKMNSINLSNTYQLNTEENIMVGWSGLGLNQRYNKTNLSLTSDQISTLSEYNFFNIGCRSANATNTLQSVYFNQKIKSIIIFNSDEYGNYNNLVGGV
jgi:hypothetical protein